MGDCTEVVESLGGASILRSTLGLPGTQMAVGTRDREGLPGETSGKLETHRSPFVGCNCNFTLGRASPGPSNHLPRLESHSQPFPSPPAFLRQTKEVNKIQS